MILQTRIINLFLKESAGKKLNNTQQADLLFDLLLNFITKHKWTYFPDSSGFRAQRILYNKTYKNIALNCFELSELFLNVCDALGIAHQGTYIYEYRLTSKIGQLLSENGSSSRYTFKCFDSRFICIDNQLCFNHHCVAQVNGKFYDLTLSSAYHQEDTPYDNDAFAKALHFLYLKNESEALEVLKSTQEIDFLKTFRGDTLLHIAAHAHFMRVVSLLLPHINANTLSQSEFPMLALDHVDDINSELFTLLAQHTEPEYVEQTKQARARHHFFYPADTVNKTNIDDLAADTPNHSHAITDKIEGTSMHLLESLIAVLGTAVVATVFIILNAATYNTPQILVAGFGSVSILLGIGIFATRSPVLGKSVTELMAFQY